MTIAPRHHRPAVIVGRRRRSLRDLLQPRRGTSRCPRGPALRKSHHWPAPAVRADRPAAAGRRRAGLLPGRRLSGAARGRAASGLGRRASRSARSTARSSPATRRSKRVERLRRVLGDDHNAPFGLPRPRRDRARSRAGRSRARRVQRLSSATSLLRRHARILHAPRCRRPTCSRRARRGARAGTRRARCEGDAGAAGRLRPHQCGRDAVQRRCGQRADRQFVYFDNHDASHRPEHVIASGSLPPGFPATEIEGEHYWDGGLVSNTPLNG